MAIGEITNPYEFFTNADGTPLEAGQIYIGVDGLDPQDNPQAAYFDLAGTIGATQPIRTLGGYPVNAGSPTKIFTDGSFSVKVLDENNNLVYSDLSVSQIEDSVDAVTARVDDMAVPFDTVADFFAATLADIKAAANATTGTAYVVIKDGGHRYSLDLSQAAAFNHTTTSGAEITVLRNDMGVFSAKSFNARGDGGDDTAALVAAMNALEDGDTLDLGYLEIAIFNSISGTAQATSEQVLAGTYTDAAALTDVPFLENMSNVTIQNGTIYAKSPAVSGTKLFYPTTLSMLRCEDMKLINVTLRSKGESYGDTDRSNLLPKDGSRAEFAVKNGGHAFLFAKSKGLTTINCRYELCGSVGAFYSMSSDGVVLSDDYATAQSLGYAGIAQDSWEGTSADNGFDMHRMIMRGCLIDDNGSTYGSKGCVATEDADVYLLALNCVFKDAYPNGAAPDIGYGIMCNVSTVVAIGCHFENCAAMGCTDMSVDAVSSLTMISCTSKNLRTSGHIQRQKSFGTSDVKYINCQFDISGAVVWPSVPELSVPSLVANRKTASRIFVDMINCTSTGAHTLAVNSVFSYGGLRISGGHHTVSDRIMDSDGWGSSQPDEYQGLEILGGATIVVTEAVSDAAITDAARTDLILKPNQSDTSFTYQTVNIDDTVIIDCKEGFHSLIFTPTTGGASLDQKQVYAAKKVNCYQTKQRGLGPHLTSFTVVSKDGISGSNAKITIAMDQGTFVPNNATFYDDTDTRRKLVSTYAGPDATSGQLEFGYFLDTSVYNVTVGDTYTLTAKD